MNGGRIRYADCEYAMMDGEGDVRGGLHARASCEAKNVQLYNSVVTVTVSAIG